ncbi:MAG: ABC transporter permease, partial [Desulfobacula sp.]|nr:ABC transporter permease [Desulfobacula sp.]
RWILNLAKGNLGVSLETQTPVSEIIFERLPVSLELMFLSQFLALLIAVPLAISSALNADSAFDRLTSGIGLIFFSIPAFVIALVLILIFAIFFKLFPSTGFVPLSESLHGNIRSMFLPALSIALTEWVALMRILRDSLINILKQDFILNARSNGLSFPRILLGHALKPSLMGLITLVGINMGHLIGGAIVVEIIFAIPGFGSLLFNSVLSQDYPLVLGCVMVTAAVFVLINFIVDNIYRFIDPRTSRR